MTDRQVNDVLSRDYGPLIGKVAVGSSGGHGVKGLVFRNNSYWISTHTSGVFTGKGCGMFFQLLIMVLPWRIRRILLNWRYDWEIDRTATIGKSIILARKVKMGPKSRIHNLVICKRIDLLELREDSGISTVTYITGFSTVGGKWFKHVTDRRCELVLGAHAGITSRHYIDCNGGVYVGDYTTVAGIRTQVLTHSIDVYNNRQDAKPVKIGKYCFIGTGSILLPGCELPDYSILGAGAVLTKAYDQAGMLYAGTPAKPIKKLDVQKVPYFHRRKHVVD